MSPKLHAGYFRGMGCKSCQERQRSVLAKAAAALGVKTPKQEMSKRGPKNKEDKSSLKGNEGRSFGDRSILNGTADGQNPALPTIRNIP